MAYASKPEPVAPPTIGFLKSQSIEAARVFCASIYCGRMVVMAFDDIGLPDHTPFPAIKTQRRWACQRCGNREVSLMPNWRDPRAVQAERVGQPQPPDERATRELRALRDKAASGDHV